MRGTTKKLLAVLLAMTVAFSMAPGMALAGQSKDSGADRVNSKAAVYEETAGSGEQDGSAAEEPENRKVSVSFTLRGDAKHDEGAHTDYQAWISRKTLVFEGTEPVTALAVMERAMNEEGISYVCQDGYISAVNGLTYGDNGPNSGWMYLVNGQMPSVGAGELEVKDSDEILFYYTDDYMIDDSMIEGKPSGGETEAEKLARLIDGVKKTEVNLKPSAEKSGIILTWSKSKGYKVDGYEIYRGTAADSMTKYGATQKTVYKNARYLQKGTKYYYKVRGYRDFSGQRVYTQWSGTAQQTAKATSVDNGVRGTSVKAKCEAGKGRIKLSWTMSKGYKVDYFEIYRAAKNGAFGKTPYMTTKNGAAKVFTDTKGLKKGTKYRYKVRGVRMMDGRKVCTGWSNQAAAVCR